MSSLPTRISAHSSHPRFYSAFFESKIWKVLIILAQIAKAGHSIQYQNTSQKRIPSHSSQTNSKQKLTNPTGHRLGNCDVHFIYLSCNTVNFCSI